MAAPSAPARFVAIDWSGARDPRAQREAIVACVVEPGAGGRTVTALAGGRDRQEIVAWLAGLAGDGVPTLVGLDFPFSYAIPFLDRLRMRDFSALLAHMASLAAADAFIDACGEWWQRCGGRGDRRTRRGVERQRQTQGAESPLRALRRANGRYGFVGARQVGKAAITGIAALAELKRQAPAVRVWPFEDPAGAPLVVAEIWPRLALGRVVKSDAGARRRHVRALRRQEIRLSPVHRQRAARSDHAIDALAAAVAMASGCWPLTERSRLPAAARREGWILGVDPILPKPTTRSPQPEARHRKEAPMDPITPHLDRAGRQARRAHLDGAIARSPMKVAKSMKTLGREVFADGALSKKHKELTALAVAVATNCWE